MAHALLSPSGASRWLNCTPSARLEEQVEDRSSEAAREGTLAHFLSETILSYSLGRISKQAYEGTLRVIKEDELYDESMMDYCMDYTSIILEKYQLAKARTPSAVIYLEEKFDLTKYIPGGFGTSDVVIIEDDTLFVDDLKYGKGVAVSAVENRQAMLYGLGAFLEFCYAYDIQKIVVSIHQPRIDNSSSWEISRDDLLKWADTELKEKAALADKGEGEFNPGKHCQFCKVKAICRANHDHQMEIAKHEFKEPALLTPEEIASVLDRIKSFEGWIKAVGEYALEQALHKDVTWPGYKLVEGKSMRKYENPDVVLYALLNAGFTLDKISNTKPLGLGEMEKAIGKEKFAGLLAPLIIKPKGKPALVPESDKRPAINTLASAQKDFEES